MDFVCGCAAVALNDCAVVREEKGREGRRKIKTPTYSYRKCHLIKSRNGVQEMWLLRERGRVWEGVGGGKTKMRSED